VRAPKSGGRPGRSLSEPATRNNNNKDVLEMLKQKPILLLAMGAATLACVPLVATAGSFQPRTVVRRAESGPVPIVLGPALAPFALLAATTITDVGNTLVTNSFRNQTNALMGVYPGSAVTGFYPPATDADGPNAIYAAGFNSNRSVPMAAQAALATAYNTAAAEPATALVAGDLSLVKVPGYPTGTLPPASTSPTRRSRSHPATTRWCMGPVSFRPYSCSKLRRP
jgi:hypothetical protein